MRQREHTFTHLPERIPLACQWEITCRCNLRCIMCYTDCFNQAEKIKQELSTQEIFRIMDELAEAGCLDLCLTGGEPLARPDFMDVYNYAIQKGFLVTIFTNGTLLTEDIADRWVERPPHRIEISLHGLTEQTFEQVTRGKGSFDHCHYAIQLLLERHLPLILKTTAMTFNHHEILAIKEYVYQLGSVKYQLGEDMRPCLDGSQTPEAFGLSPEEITELNRQDPELWIEACQQASQRKPACTSGQRRFHIDAYGQLQLCSGNRQLGYDLRNGSFNQGFYEALPNFPCQWKESDSQNLIQVGGSHA